MATFYGWGGQYVAFWCGIFSRFRTPNIVEVVFILTELFKKNKKSNIISPETAKVLHTIENLPFVFDVFVDKSCDGERSKGKVPAGNDRQSEVEDDAGNSQSPVIVAEPWSPVGRLQERLHHADQVHE